MEEIYKKLPGYNEAYSIITNFATFKHLHKNIDNSVEKYLNKLKTEPDLYNELLYLSNLTQNEIKPEDYIKYLNKLVEDYKENIFSHIADILNKFEKYRKQTLDNTNTGLVEKNKELEQNGEEIINIDGLLSKTENKINPSKPILKVSQPDNYFSYNPTYNYTLYKNYNTVSIEPLQEDYNTLSIANKKLQDDYNTLSIAKNQLEEDNKQLQEDYNKKLNENKARYKNNLKLLEEDYNNRVKNIIDDANGQIEELKKKNKLVIDKGAEFEVNNKKLSDIDIQTTSPTQSNKNIQTSLPSLYITEFRETYNQQGDYNKRIEAIQKNANKKVNAIKNIYKQAKEDLIDEYNNLTNQLKEEYRNKKIRQNEYFEIPSEEQQEDNNTTNEFILTNNKDMTDINPQMTSPQTIPLDQKITPPIVSNTPPPQEATGKDEEVKPEEDKPDEEEKTEEQPTKDIVDDTNINEEEEDKPIEEEKKEEKKIIPIDKVSDELAKVIDSFYIQDKPIEETFSKLEETINNIPDEIFYTIMPYFSGALANITVGGQKVFNDEAEVQELLLKIKNPNKINKRYKLPKKLDKAITQSRQGQLTLSPMLLRNRKQTNINKNIYQY